MRNEGSRLKKLFVWDSKQKSPFGKRLNRITMVQPDGPSFTIDGHRVRWGNWDFHLSVDARGGLIVSLEASVEMGKRGKQRRYWLLKTEPGEWSWKDQAENGGISKWDGVKNSQAQKNLKAMKLEDLCFFYHSGVKQRQVVGVVSVVKEWYEEEGGGGVAVDVKQVREMRRCMDLKELTGDDGMKGFVLFRQPMLSVVPVEEAFWERVCESGGGFEGDGRKYDGGGGGSSSGADE